MKTQAQLEAENTKLKARVQELEVLNKWYEEQLKLSRQKQFGSSSEKSQRDDLAQLNLFNEAEAERAQNYRADAIGTSVAYTAMSAFSTAYRGGKSFTGLSVSTGDDIKSENNSSNDAIHDDEIKAALTNMKVAIGGAKGAVDELADIFGGIVKAADANNGKIPNLNDIARQVLEDELKELEANGGDKARIKELRDILKPV